MKNWREVVKTIVSALTIDVNTDAPYAEGVKPPKDIEVGADPHQMFRTGNVYYASLRKSLYRVVHVLHDFHTSIEVCFVNGAYGNKLCLS